MSSFLFLDANVFLSFYLYAKDDLSEMEKLVKLAGDAEINLLTNDQLNREVRRNRETKIGEGLKDFSSINYGKKLPSYCSDYDEAKKLNEQLKKLSKIHSSLKTKVEADIQNKNLKADRLISELFTASQSQEITKEVLDRARYRVEMREPPGKNNSIGDAIHWESLLASNAKQLDLVSLDGDFASPLQPQNINDYLLEEWKKRKKSGGVTLYRSLAEYFSAQYPQVELSRELEKDELINQLATSPNFATTHLLVSELVNYENFTRAQIGKIFDALFENTQINWIATDEDVHDFYCRFKHKVDFISETKLQEAAKLLELDEDFFSTF